jgi:hypothetical protein
MDTNTASSRGIYRCANVVGGNNGSVNLDKSIKILFFNENTDTNISKLWKRTDWLTVSVGDDSRCRLLQRWADWGRCFRKQHKENKWWTIERLAKKSYIIPSEIFPQPESNTVSPTCWLLSVESWRQIGRMKSRQPQNYWLMINKRFHNCNYEY